MARWTQRHCALILYTLCIERSSLRSGFCTRALLLLKCTRREIFFSYSVVVDSGEIRTQFTRTLNFVVNCELGRWLVRTAECLLSLRLPATPCDNDRTFEIQYLTLRSAGFASLSAMNMRSIFCVFFLFPHR